MVDSLLAWDHLEVSMEDKAVITTNFVMSSAETMTPVRGYGVTKMKPKRDLAAANNSKSRRRPHQEVGSFQDLSPTEREEMAALLEDAFARL